MPINWCRNCSGAGWVGVIPRWVLWLFDADGSGNSRLARHAIRLCEKCGGDGYAKPPGWPDEAEIRRLRPPVPNPPAPPYKLAPGFYTGKMAKLSKVIIRRYWNGEIVGRIFLSSDDRRYWERQMKPLGDKKILRRHECGCLCADDSFQSLDPRAAVYFSNQ